MRCKHRVTSARPWSRSGWKPCRTSKEETSSSSASVSSSLAGASRGASHVQSSRPVGSCRVGHRYAHRVLQLLQRYPVLLGDDAQGPPGTEHLQRVLNPAATVLEDRLSEAPGGVDDDVREAPSV